MKSTGEVLGIAATLEEALYKGLVAAGYEMKKNGGVLITVRDRDKAEVADIAKGFADMGFELYATEGTAHILEGEGMTVSHVDKIHESDNNCITLLEAARWTISYPHLQEEEFLRKIPSRSDGKAVEERFLV